MEEEWFRRSSDEGRGEGGTRREGGNAVKACAVLLELFRSLLGTVRACMSCSVPFFFASGTLGCG